MFLYCTGPFSTNVQDLDEDCRNMADDSDDEFEPCCKTVLVPCMCILSVVRNYIWFSISYCLSEDKLMNCLPVRLSNVFDPGLHRKLWSGVMHARDANQASHVSPLVV